MRVLCADSVDESSLTPLLDAGHECVVDASLSADSLGSALSEIDVLVVRSTKVNAAALSNANRLGLIVRAGAGTDNIDREAASAKGILVCNVPGRNAVAVAELTIGLLLSIDRQIPSNDADIKAKAWNKATYSKADGLLGKSLGIIGLGDIGMAVAERAKSFGLSVLAERKGGRRSSIENGIRRVGITLVDSREELLGTSDVISLHMPKSPENKQMVNADFLAQMKIDSILLNTSRGDLVDEEALVAALDAGRVRAGIDVWMNEPSSSNGEFHSALAQHPRVVGTHHIGASTTQAQRSTARGTVETIEAYLAGSPINCVNLRAEMAGAASLTIRHHDKVGVLAQIFSILRASGINVQQMQNQVFQGGAAAVATINVSDRPPADAIDNLCAIDEVLHVSIVDMPQS